MTAPDTLEREDGGAAGASNADVPTAGWGVWRIRILLVRAGRGRLGTRLRPGLKTTVGRLAAVSGCIGLMVLSESRLGCSRLGVRGLTRLGLAVRNLAGLVLSGLVLSGLGLAVRGLPVRGLAGPGPTVLGLRVLGLGVLGLSRRRLAGL